MILEIDDIISFSKRHKNETIRGFQTIFQGADGFPWKACERQKRFASSNLALSASKRLIFNRLQSQKHFFCQTLKKRRQCIIWHIFDQKCTFWPK